MAGRKECFPSQFALFPSFEYYSFCSAHTYRVDYIEYFRFVLTKKALGSFLTFGDNQGRIQK